MTITAIHGLSAYRRTSPSSALGRALWVHYECTKEELCCADKLIGPVGLVVAGEASIVWAEDVWSEPEDDGGRNSSQESHGIEQPSEAEWRQFAADMLLFRGGRGYCEAWVSHTYAVRVIYSDPEWSEAAQMIADALGIRCEEVPKGYRISLPEGDARAALEPEKERLEEALREREEAVKRARAEAMSNMVIRDRVGLWQSVAWQMEQRDKVAAVLRDVKKQMEESDNEAH